MDDRREVPERMYAVVEKVGRAEYPYSMPYEHFDIFYGSGPKQPQTLSGVWPRLKNWR